MCVLKTMYNIADFLTMGRRSGFTADESPKVSKLKSGVCVLGGGGFYMSASFHYIESEKVKIRWVEKHFTGRLTSQAQPQHCVHPPVYQMKQMKEK